MAAARSAAALIATAVTLALVVLTPQSASAHPGHGNGPQAVEARPARGRSSPNGSTAWRSTSADH